MSPSRRVLDARGLACPQPVILTRKALAEGGFSELEVIVNTSSGRENVARFAGHAGCTIDSIEESGEETRIVIQPPVADRSNPTSTESLTDATMPPVEPGTQTVFLSGRTIGRGDDELGALLMQAFLYTLTESETLPQRRAAHEQRSDAGGRRLRAPREPAASCRSWCRDPRLWRLSRVLQAHRSAGRGPSLEHAGDHGVSAPRQCPQSVDGMNLKTANYLLQLDARH